VPEEPADRGRAVGLTRRGWTVAGAAGGLVVGSRVLGAGPLAGLGIAGGLLLALAGAWVLVRRPQVDLVRAVRPRRLHAGGEARVMLDGPPGPATPLLTLRDDVDGGRRSARFLVAPRPAHAPLRAAYRIPTPTRGRHVVGPLVATITDPLGLARRSWVVAAPIDVVVCPRVHAIRPPVRGGGGEPATHVEGARAPALEPLGEFLSLRDYEPGDDPRRVHWRATARTGDLVVRQDEASSPGRVVLLLDTRGDVHDRGSFEHAVEAVASLAVRLHREHAPLEVATTAGEVLARPGPGAVDLLLERLALVATSDDDRTAEVLAALRRRLGIGTVVAVTGALDARLRDAVSPLADRRVVTIVATRAPAAGDARAGLGVALVDAATRPFPIAWDSAIGPGGRRVAESRAGRSVASGT